MRSARIRPLPTLFPYKWKTEAEVLIHLYLSKAAQDYLLQALRNEQKEREGTVIFTHPLLQSPISLHPGADINYIQSIVEYELVTHYVSSFLW